MSPPLYFAFRSGSLTFDCAPCGRCCKGGGFGAEPRQLAESAELIQIGAFAAPRLPGDPLASFFTFADGCRFLDNDNLCDLHKKHGPRGKPRVCRLFPFSRLVELEGLFIVLPSDGCPWGPSSSAAPHSDHATLEGELRELGIDKLRPRKLAPVTSLAADKRLRLEQSLTNALNLDADPSDVLDAMIATQEKHIGAAFELPPHDLWFDLLRCAGEPPPLSPANRRLFLVSIPTLRILAAESFPLAAIPGALAAFEIWLRSLQELGARDLTGEDLLRFFDQGLPLVKILTFADRPLRYVPPELLAPKAPLAALWQALASRPGAAMGEVLAECLRAEHIGPLSVLALFGQALNVGLVA